MEHNNSPLLKDRTELASLNKFSYNPKHAVGTCGACGEEMTYNVPRLGVHGGLIHKDTGKYGCAPLTPKLFRSGMLHEDMMSLIDGAYSQMELWKPGPEEIYNIEFRKAWLERAKELGVDPE